MKTATKPLPSLRHECPGGTSLPGSMPCWKAWVLICFFIPTSAHKDRDRLVCCAHFQMVILGVLWVCLVHLVPKGKQRWTWKMDKVWLPDVGKEVSSLCCPTLLLSRLLLSGASTKLRSGICFGQGIGGLRAIGPAGILGDLEIAFGYRLGNTVQMRTLHFFPTWSCCNSSTQTLGLGRKEQTKMCSSFVLVFLEGAVPIWWA